MPLSAPNYRTFFPGLTDANHKKTSEWDISYNCIGHAAGTREWWQAAKVTASGIKCFWPAGVLWAKTIEAHIEAYATVGYLPCASGDLEDGIEKVALFAIGSECKHAARQLSDGKWTSKLGQHVDIAHELDALAGDQYGKAVAFLSRPRQNAR